jgi:hypothetical protein
VSARPSDLLSEEFRVHPEGFWSTAHLLGDDGYDRMTTAAQRGWNAVAAWGGQGWDLGECPYAVIFHRTRDGAYELAENVEGDVTMYSYPTRALRDRATDAMAFFHWRLHDEEWVTGLATPRTCPPRCAGRSRGSAAMADDVVAHELVAAVLTFLDCDTARGVTDQRTLAAKAALRDQLDQCIDHGNEVELDTGPVLTVLDGGVQ